MGLSFFLFQGAMLLLFILLVSPCLTSFVGLVPVVDIDVDGDLSDRWGESLKTVVALHGWNHSFGPIFDYYDKGLFSRLSPKDRDMLASTVEKFFPSQALELKGLASSFAALGHGEVNFSYLCLWVYFHELAHTELAAPEVAQKLRRSCTALLAVDPVSGLVTHGRNMDNVPVQLRNVSLHHRWMKNDRVVFESLTWYWITTGFMTGLKQKVTTLEENWRFETTTLSSVLSYAFNGTLPQVFWFRRIFETADSFSEVTDFVSQTPLPVGMYVIASGPGKREGVIYSLSAGVNHNRVYDLRNMSDTFMVQTNYDRWLPDDPQDDRRTVAENQMRAFNDTSIATMFATLSTYPVQNEDTAFTALMSSSSNRFQCFIRQSIVSTD